jgi:hypothetical protein
MWAKDADSTVAASSYAVLLCLMGATFVALYTPTCGGSEGMWARSCKQRDVSGTKPLELELASCSSSSLHSLRASHQDCHPISLMHAVSRRVYRRPRRYPDGFTITDLGTEPEPRHPLGAATAARTLRRRRTFEGGYRGPRRVRAGEGQRRRRPGRAVAREMDDLDAAGWAEAGALRDEVPAWLDLQAPR